MAKTIVVLISWIKLNALKIAAFGENVVKMMTGNTYFPKPDIDLKEIAAACDRLRKSYNDRDKGEVAKLEYENALNDLNKLLRNQADYVSRIAKGDASIIISAGFKPTSPTASKPTTAPQAIASVVLSTNQSGGGTLYLKIQKVAQADNYIYVIFLGDLGTVKVGKKHITVAASTVDYVIIPKGNTSEVVEGLPIGTKVNVIAFAENSAGISIASPVANIVVN